MGGAAIRRQARLMNSLSGGCASCSDNIPGVFQDAAAAGNYTCVEQVCREREGNSIRIPAIYSSIVAIQGDKCLPWRSASFFPLNRWLTAMSNEFV